MKEIYIYSQKPYIYTYLRYIVAACGLILCTYDSPAFAVELPGRSAQTSLQLLLTEGVVFSPLQDETHAVPERRHTFSYDVWAEQSSSSGRVAGLVFIICLKPSDRLGTAS